MISPTAGSGERKRAVNLTTGVTDGGRVQLTVSGDIDIATAPALREAGLNLLATVECTELTIMLDGVTFLDSIAIGVLVEIRNATTATSRLILREPSKSARRLLQLTDLYRVFDVIHDDDRPAETSLA
jgi:anti-sigma B factor antagonist